MMSMLFPSDRILMEFHVAAVDCGPDSYHRVADVRACSVDESAGIENVHTSPIARTKFR